jgi:hypothetical protein
MVFTKHRTLLKQLHPPPSAISLNELFRCRFSNLEGPYTIFLTFKFLFMETLVRYGKTVSKMYDAFSKGDIPYIISCLHKDVIWEVMGQPDIPHAGIYHGPDDVKSFFRKMDEHVQYTEFVAEHILENGNLVISTGYAKGKARKTGKLLSTIWAMSSEFDEDGKLVHFRDCYDTQTVARALKM